ncbi:MAG: hypothetical protein KIT31_41700, partial [Deltaproteobacteria bacterium]|nr:hypothetical protein [Deltaproteobacteria bacterium]
MPPEVTVRNNADASTLDPPDHAAAIAPTIAPAAPTDAPVDANGATAVGSAETVGTGGPRLRSGIEADVTLDAGIADMPVL